MTSDGSDFGYDADHSVWQRPAEDGSDAAHAGRVVSPGVHWDSPLTQIPGMWAQSPETAAPARHTRWTTRTKAAAAASLLVVGAVAGGGIAHAAFTPKSTTTSASAPATVPGTTTPGTSSGSGGTTGGSTYGGTTGGTGGFGSSPFGGTGTSPYSQSQQGSTSSSGSASDGPTDAATIAKDVDPGLVDITTTISGGEAAGTGMVLTKNGEVLTNNHVIDGATSISVRDVGNNTTYKATVVGYDRTADIAVLQLTNASNLTTVTIASAQPAVGAAVVGIGNAGGAGGTPSYAGGAVTALGQSITASDEYGGTSEQLTGLIGTDAPIQAGDSGGPLVNAAGKVVGVDTAASTSSGYSGASYGNSSAQGYAIPITTALTLANAMEAGQSSSTIHIGPTAQLGVYIGTATASQNGYGASSTAGAPVEQVVTSGPAAAAGIAAGDTITSLNGSSVADANALSSIVTNLKPGQQVSVGYTDSSGTSHTATVTLGTGVPQ